MESQPLRQSTDTFLGKLLFWVKFSVVITIMGLGYGFVFGDEAKIKSKTGKNFAALSSQTAADLSGKWEGKFIYPKGVKTQLTMNITASCGVLSGNLTETDPKTNQPVNSTISGSIKNRRQIHFTQDFGAKYPKARCDANYDATSKSMAGKCAAAGQSANFTARLL